MARTTDAIKTHFFSAIRAFTQLELMRAEPRVVNRIVYTAGDTISWQKQQDCDKNRKFLIYLDGEATYYRKLQAEVNAMSNQRFLYKRLRQENYWQQHFQLSSTISQFFLVWGAAGATSSKLNITEQIATDTIIREG